MIEISILETQKPIIKRLDEYIVAEMRIQNLKSREITTGEQRLIDSLEELKTAIKYDIVGMLDKIELKPYKS